MPALLEIETQLVEILRQPGIFMSKVIKKR